MKSITYLKMAATGGIICIGGPALVYWVTPSEEELFLKYNPELQRRSIEKRKENQENFDTFVGKLKEYSKSDKQIWTVWEQEAEKHRKQGVQAELDRRRDAEAMRQEIKGSIK
ncbi:related to Assembly factor cbp4 [Ramularia collo-cygni]|uniref:Cytochrome b mRNA-processing protein 4 n=1 Tax=Ramularia collo-cygni TaxID=112498 RepID=A0A2D3V6J0_9PEZI|nr:related to Assembly factor cbp4 [Ramularia collo-cygni]CZT21050.1 related to Assembly factor cbp4 [Ramularia collo-cygni]